MKALAILCTLAAWGCVLLAPRSTLGSIVQLMVFGLLGTVLTLAGGFSYWWDSGMQPGKKSAVLLVCGLLILASQAGALLQAVLGDEGGTDWPGRRGRKK